MDDVILDEQEEVGESLPLFRFLSGIIPALLRFRFVVLCNRGGVVWILKM